MIARRLAQSVIAAALLSGAAVAGEATAGSVDTGGASIVLLGEIHDNPAHHLNQARLVERLKPSALMFEMLTPEQAAAAAGTDRTDAAAMEAALGWAGTGWPDYALYHPVFAAAPDAALYGAAVPRDRVSEAMRAGAAALVASIVIAPLPEAEQAEREAMQADAHCGALPPEMLPGMVEAQRFRDASFAATALRALEETGGPVAVITGNGHARRDWGMPVYLALMAPGTPVFALGQFEEEPDAPPPFDAWLVTAPAEREDPCAAFR